MVLGDISTRKDWATQKQGVMALSDFGEMGRHIVYSLGLLSEPQIGTVFLHLALPVEAELQAVQTRLWMRLSLMAVAFLVLGQLVMAVTQRTISQPVEGLTREIKGIARNGEGKLTVSDRSVRTVAEFGQISDSFRQMSAERQEARADDQRRLALMSALLDAVPDTYFRVGPQGEILDYRSEDSTNLYLPPEAFMGRLVTDVLPPDLGRDFRRHHKRALATGRTSSWDYAIEVKGKVQYYEARICVVSGGPEAIVIVRNITGRMRADRKLRATEERLDRIIANLPGAVIQRRYDGGPLGKVTFISAKCEEIWGIPARDLQADVSLFGKAHDPDDLPIFYAEREAAFRAGQPFYRRFQITHTSGETRWVDYFSTPPYQHSENGDHYVEAFALDVTREVAAQKRYEREREVSHRAQKSEMIGQLTGGVAHDFNNLLAVIMGNLELLRDDNTNSAQSALINSALSATQRGGDLTRSMLAFARKAPLSPQRIYLNDLVLEQRDWIGRTLPARISLETDLADDLWPIEADTGSTESALLNLILNARDAMEQGGNLRIEAKNLFVEQRIRDGHDADLAPGRYVSLSVSDTGHGIPPEQLSQVFEPFFSTKAPGAGSGLGLSMVMGFMRQSGGTVQVESLPGEGTTFRLVFQAVNEDQDKFQGPARVEVSSGVFAGRRVLIVEDEPDVLTILVNGLRKAGFEVRAAGSGDEAKEIFSKDPEFDLLISDIVMPGRLQGPMLVKELRSIRPDLPVVFLSGYASETLVQEYALRDEDIRLMKPVRRADLLRAAAQALRIQTED
jgi:signal transduction histidine kinase/ActR/RegA family two-component response regulator